MMNCKNLSAVIISACNEWMVLPKLSDSWYFFDKINEMINHYLSDIYLSTSKLAYS